MKINQVEELVGITKKNIRFYEDQGLITPQRNPENGYREYSLADVDKLLRIRLFRQLDIPCEQIRRMQEGVISFDECMQDHIVALSHRSRDLERMKEICERMAGEVDDPANLRASEYLEQMKKLEEGGVRFVEVKETDVNKRRTGAIVAALVMIAFIIGMIRLLFWAQSVDPLPIWGFVLIILPLGAVVIGVAIALKQRMDELKRREIDEARNY